LRESPVKDSVTLLKMSSWGFLSVSLNMGVMLNGYGRQDTHSIFLMQLYISVYLHRYEFLTHV
jgi:hypothetical protein